MCLVGHDPTIPCLRDRCFNQLSYRHLFVVHDGIGPSIPCLKDRCFTTQLMDQLWGYTVRVELTWMEPQSIELPLFYVTHIAEMQVSDTYPEYSERSD